MPRIDNEEKRRVLLRTTADAATHFLLQMECCAAEWPEYVGEAKSLKTLSEGLVAHAREVGYIGRDASKR
jgi:hypothetical protein